jgi:hypothetical protein
VALQFTIKKVSEGKRRIMETQIFQPCKNIICKKSSKRNQNPSRYYYNSRTNLKFQHKPKYIIFQKSSYKKNRPILLLLLLLLPRGQNPLSYYTLSNKPKHNNILALVSKAKNQKKIIPFVGRYPCDPPTR